MSNNDWTNAESELARWYRRLNQAAAELRQQQGTPQPAEPATATGRPARPNDPRVTPSEPLPGAPENRAQAPERLPGAPENRAAASQPAPATSAPPPHVRPLRRAEAPSSPVAALAPIARRPLHRRSGQEPGDALPTPVTHLTTGRSVALLHRRYARPDESILHLLDRRLSAEGYAVFVDRHLAAGADWVRELESRARDVDAVVVLLSTASVHSEALATEVQLVRRAHERDPRRARLLPVRVRYAGALPEPLDGCLDAASCALWDGPEDDERLVARILEALRTRGGTAPGEAAAERRQPEAPPTPGDTVSGAVAERPEEPDGAAAPALGPVDGDAQDPSAADTAPAETRADIGTLLRLPPPVREVLLSSERETAQRYYSRPFKETRAELIERLLDPPLTLEETARVLNVCPMTVRRYTNRGVLPHFRTAGAQRRFRLSEVLAFLERHGRLDGPEEE